MKLSELEPWKAMKALLKDNVVIAVSPTERRTLKVYGQGEMPNMGLAEEFIFISNNGVIDNLTTPYGLFRGNLAITLYIKAQSNGTVKENRIKSAISQIEELVSNKSKDGFFFSFAASNIITPPDVNESSGYSLTILNTEWHTSY